MPDVIRKSSYDVVVQRAGSLLLSLEDTSMTFRSLPILALILTGCGGSVHELTAVEQMKLDPALQILIIGSGIDPADYDISRGPNGDVRYGVIVRSTDVEELKEAGYNVTSNFDGVMVVRVNVNELRELVALPSVKAVSAGSKFRTQQPLNKPNVGSKH